MPFSSAGLYLFLIYGICNGFATRTVKLLDGNKMPVVGLGTYKMLGKQIDTAITTALESGYRHIDTAFYYNNEKGIGKSLKKWISKEGGKREDVYITTKLPIQAIRPSDVETALKMSLNNLGVNYIDMYLIHVPVSFHRTKDFQVRTLPDGNIDIDFSTDHVAIWKELEKQVKAGRVKSIGLSNFNKTQILRVWNNAKIKPTNLQVEANAYLQQEELLDLCNKLGIVMTGYSPIGSSDIIKLRRKREAVQLPPLLEHPVVEKIAKKHSKTPAQVLLRYNLQRGLVVIPKSVNPKRIKENINIFNFKLTKDDMAQLRGLDLHGKYRKFDFLTYKGVEKHPEYPFTDRIPK